MNVRIWIDPKNFVVCHSIGCPPCIEFNDVRQTCHEEGGLLYLDVRTDSPLNPQIRRHIIKVTTRVGVSDQSHMKKIQSGRYVHGRFEARVTKNFTPECLEPKSLEILASAPTVGLMKRWINEILAGKDTPRDVYGQ